MTFRPHNIQTAALVAALALASGPLPAQETGKKSSSYAPVVIQEDFATVMSRMSAAKAGHHAASEGVAGGALRPKRPPGQQA